MTPPEQDVVLALARQNFAAFIAAFWAKFQLAPHIRLLVEKFERVVHGQLLRLAVSLPPRHGKSETLSVYGPAFFLGHHPDQQAIFCTYNQDIADTFGRRVRNLMLEPLYQRIFPNATLSGDSQAASRLSTTAGGGFIATGRGGSLTGQGGNLIIADDLVKDQEEAASTVIRRQVQEWMQHVLFTRLEPDARLIFIGTRWALDDPIGYVLAEQAAELWDAVNLPALAEPGDPLGRVEGEALWPARFPVEALERRRAEIGMRAWASLYQGRPVPEGGAIFKTQSFKYYREAPACESVVLSIDSAFKVGEQNDFSVIQAWGTTESGFYLLDNWRARVEFPELQRAAEALAAKWNPAAVLIEDRASGQSLIQSLERETRLPVLPVKVGTDKSSRAHAVTPLVESGRVFFPEGASWLADYVDELAAFPGGRHDDQVDATTQALNYLRGGAMPGQSVFDLYEEMAERARGGKAEEPPVPATDMSPWLRRW